jgi:hypothetical protein
MTEVGAKDRDALPFRRLVASGPDLSREALALNAFELPHLRLPTSIAAAHGAK